VEVKMATKLKVLRRGMREPLVGIWQEYLLGEGLYKLRVDRDFGYGTHKSTVAYQTKYKLFVDGEVGNGTWGHALANGLELLPNDAIKTLGPKHSADYPPPPTNVRPVRPGERNRMFGRLQYKPSGKGDAIIITNGWNRGHLKKVHIPQLAGVKGAPKSCKVFWHADYTDELIDLWEDWEKQGLLPYVKSWAGSWCARFIRGSRRTLSNHSWATAFDINVAWNGLRKRPALWDAKGTVRPLVQTANEWGFYWGGHFKRKDGMHFEVGQRR